MKRTICQVLASVETGGLERHFVDLCNALGKRHHVTVIAHPMHRHCFDNSARFVAFDFGRGRYNPSLLLSLYRILKNTSPDLVHTHANKATAMVGLLKPLLSMSFVATLHNRKSRASMFRKCDGVIVVSHSLVDCVPGKEVVVIHNGIDLPAPVDPATVESLRQSCKGRPLVLAVGRLVRAKGFDGLLRAWQPMSAQLWIAGEGPQRTELETIIRQYRLEDRVKLLGHREDIDVLMEAVDLLVMPSRTEGFPYVLLEALHHNLPLVASSVPGVVDVVPASWLYPIDDEAALSKLLTRALSKPEQLREDFIPVWQSAREELSLANMVRRTEVFYHKVLHA